MYIFRFLTGVTLYKQRKLTPQPSSPPKIKCSLFVKPFSRRLFKCPMLNFGRDLYVIAILIGHKYKQIVSSAVASSTPRNRNLASSKVIPPISNVVPGRAFRTKMISPSFRRPEYA